MVFGILFVCMVLLSKGSASPTQFNNSSLSLILADQCVTRDEVKIEIQAQTDHLDSKLQCVTIEEVRAEIQQMQTEIQTEIQSIANMVKQLLPSGGNQNSTLPPGASPQNPTLPPETNPQNPREQLSPRGSPQNPLQSCNDVHRQPPNYYWIQNSITGTPTHQYCATNRRCNCGSIGGWMQVANFNMTNTSQNCPSGFRYITVNSKRMCGRHNIGCVSTTFPVHGVNYSRVCGKVIGYQYGSPEAFRAYYYNIALSISDTYVDGVSITHGHYPRKHIWTFAAYRSEDSIYSSRCSCIGQGSRTRVPSSVGNDYFCETGSRYGSSRHYYTEDPLWDGQGCGSSSTCCSFNHPPWFCKRLPFATRDDIEVRLCGNGDRSYEDIGIEIIQIFVQ